MALSICSCCGCGVSYLNIARIIKIAAIMTARMAIQFAHRTSLRLTSESHLLRARCRLSLLALRNINVTRSIRTHYTARSEGMGRGIPNTQYFPDATLKPAQKAQR